MQTHVATDAQRLIDAAARFEPGAVRAVSDLRDYGLTRHCRGWEVVSDDGGLAGFVVVRRICRDRWQASPVVFDPGCGRALAEVIEAGPTWELAGGAAHMDPVVPHLVRGRPAARQELLGSNQIVEGLMPDPRCRVATSDDLDALVDLYSAYELELIPTRRRLAQHLRDHLRRRPIVVMEEDGVIIAAARCEARGERYDYWSHVTIRPEARGRRLYAPLNSSLTMISTDARRCSCGAKAPSNRFRPENHPAPPELAALMLREEWVSVRFPLRNRVPGQHYLRRALEQLEGRLRRRRVEVPQR